MSAHRLTALELIPLLSQRDGCISCLMCQKTCVPLFIYFPPLSIVVFVLCWHGDNPKWIGKQFVEVGGWVIKVLLSIGICLTLILGKQSMPGFSCNGSVVENSAKKGNLKIKNIHLSDCPKSQRNKNNKKMVMSEMFKKNCIPRNFILKCFIQFTYSFVLWIIKIQHFNVNTLNGSSLFLM